MSRNLIVGFKISKNVDKYLHSVKSLFDWQGNRPSNISFYKEGKCIFQVVSHEKIIFTSDKEIYDLLINLKLVCNYENIESFKNMKYPYELNDDTMIVI